MSGLFENIELIEGTSRVASRQAVSLARARASKRFAKFLAVGDREARLALVAGDIQETVKQACADCGHEDWEGVYSSVFEHLGGREVQARRPKMCPFHREVTDISLQSGDPQAGFSAMAPHTFSENSCRGSWDGRCNFKPEMATQTYWDQKAEKADERRREREQQRVFDQEQEQPRAEDVDDSTVEEVYDPAMVDIEVSAPASQEMPLENGASEPATEFAMAARTSEALKTVDVEQGGAGPSPKMDKRKWTPENVQFLRDTESAGSPHPTEQQDIVEPIDYGKDFKDSINTVTEHQEIDKDSNPSEAGHKQQGGVFPSGNHAQPVTSAQDPDKNPIQESLEENPFDFVAEDEVAQAIRNYNGG